MKSWLSWPFARNQHEEAQAVTPVRSTSFPVLDRDSTYQRPTYSSTRSEDLVLRQLKLCNVCMNIDFQGLTANRKPKERYEIQYGLSNGLQPFSLTCSLCRLLWRDILGLTPEVASCYTVTFDFTPIHATTTHRGRSSEVLIGVWYGSGKYVGHLIFSASPDDPASVDVKKRPPVTTYNCQDSYDIARRWLRECSVNHDHCPGSIDTLLPTRVIDIGSVSRDPILYTPKPGTRGQYVALSYCWGTSQAVTLTEQRLRQPPVLFPLMTLPRTIRDALIVASQLGFRYIWIDALCIVQDSFEGQDWKKESVKMDEIYGNASLTIAAAAACSTTEGIFSYPRSQKQPSCSIPYQLSTGQAGTVFVETYPTGEDAQESLDKRAWALQEALISPRVLRFGTQQMSWKCTSLEENANGPLTMIGRSKAKHNAWTSTVVDYTSRSLTFTSDRLAALSGYAKLLSAKRPYDEYIAGMWKSELLEQLVWYRSSRSEPNPRPSSIQAPSWSWVSIDSPVGFSYWPEYYQPHCELVGIIKTGSECTQLNLHGYVKQLDYQDFFESSDGIPMSKHTFQSSKRRGSSHPFGEIIVDVSGPSKAFEDTEYPPLICLHITPTCGLVLIYGGKDSSNQGIYERIGLAIGTIFEEWFTNVTCGIYKDALVRVV